MWTGRALGPPYLYAKQGWWILSSVPRRIQLWIQIAQSWCHGTRPINRRPTRGGRPTIVAHGAAEVSASEGNGVSKIRFKLDVEQFFMALDSRRRADRMSWRDVSKVTGITPSTFTRMGLDKQRPSVDAFVTLCWWARLSPQDYLLTTEDSVWPWKAVVQ